jgi:transcriptional regulator with XRE-family HTH domain
MYSQAFFTNHSLGFWTMKITVPERLNQIKQAMGIDEDVQLAKLAGASKSTVNQWFSGGIKTITAEYAYRLEEKTGFSAKWIQLGDGPPRISQAIIHTIEAMKVMCPEQQYLVARLVDQVAKPTGEAGGKQ